MNPYWTDGQVTLEFKLASHAKSGLGDVWRLGMPPASTGHPAPFPESLPLRAIDSCGARSVLDAFAGSGTTLVAARRLGIPAIGIELSERYCELAARRLDQGVILADLTDCETRRQS